MTFETLITFVSRVLFFGILLFFLLGRWLGVRQLRRKPEAGRPDTGAIDSFIATLAGLLLAFTLFGAGERFENRRRLVVQEANAIGTAWLRLDLLTEAQQEPLRDQFREYLDARIEAYRKLQNEDPTSTVFARSTALQGTIWKSALVALREPSLQGATVLLVPALNDMFDITTTRTAALGFHMPMAIFGLLIVMTFTVAMATGDASAGQRPPTWVHMVLLSGAITVAIMAIVDYEYPREGWIRVDAADQVLIDLRASMGD